MAVETSIVVEFGDSGGDPGSVVVELDNQHPANLTDTGEVKSSFSPADRPVIIINHPSDVVITNVKSTDGIVTKIGSNQHRTRRNDYLFTLPSTENTISYSGVTGFNVTWYGNQSDITLDPVTGVLCPDSTKEAVQQLPCYGTFEYGVVFQSQYQLTPPPLTIGPDDTYTIYIVVYADVVGGFTGWLK